MPDLAWTRSSRCDSGSCVQVTYQDGAVLVRDSKLGDRSPIAAYSTTHWRHLLNAIRAADGPLGAAVDLPDFTVDWNGLILWNVHDSDQPLEFTFDEWKAFVAGVKAGDFDPDRLEAKEVANA